MPSFGETLRREREQRGITLRQIADATRVRVHYLEALESNDFSTLPGTVFNKGYVRAYASFIGADADTLVEAYVLEEQARSGKAEESHRAVLDGLSKAVEDVEATRPRRGSSRIRLILAIVLLAAGLIAAAAWGLTALRGLDTEIGRSVIPAPGMPGRAADSALEALQAEPWVAETRRPLMPTAAESGRTGVTGTSQGRRQAVSAEEPSPPAANLEAAQLAETLAERPDAGGPQERSEKATPKPDQAPPASEEATAPAVPSSGGVDALQSTGAETARLSIPESGVGTGVVDRQLVGRGNHFEAGSRVWFWTRVLGGRAGERIRHVWIYEGREVHAVELKLGGTHWRTQSYKTLNRRMLGAWTVEARDSLDRVLAREAFVCSL